MSALVSAQDIRAMDEHFSDPRLGRLYAYWLSKRLEGGPPRRRDLDPIEIPDLLPILHLIDVLWEPLRFRRIVIRSSSIGNAPLF